MSGTVLAGELAQVFGAGSVEMHVTVHDPETVRGTPAPTGAAAQSGTAGEGVPLAGRAMPGSPCAVPVGEANDEARGTSYE